MQSVDEIARANLALFQDANVESETPRLQEAAVETLRLHLDAKFVAGDARLGDLEHRRADAESVADVNLVVEHPLDGEVLSELAEPKVRPAQLGLPVGVVLE